MYPALVALRLEFRSFVFVCLGLGFVPAGCAKDLGDELGAGTETGDPGDGDGDDDPDDSPLDATGIYLLAIEHTLGPDLPLQYVLEIDNVITTEDGATADFVLHTLSLEQGEAIPGECLDGPLSYEAVEFDADGHFVLDMGMLQNGSMTFAEVMLHGHLVQPDAMCGDVEGTMTSPLEYDIAGSTFAAVPLEDGCDAEPFPGPAYNCSVLGP